MHLSNPIVVLCLLSLVALPSGAAHGARIVDQQAWPEPFIKSGQYSAEHAGAIGQSFTPTLSGVDFFVFKLEWEQGPGNSFYIEIHDGLGELGTVLGTSQTVALPPNLPLTDVEFDFNATVPLIPSNLYTALIFPTTHNPTSGPNNSNYMMCFTDDINPGGATFQIMPHNRVDMVFQEGVIITPEPSTLALAVLGFGGLVAWRLRPMRNRASIA